MFLHEFLHVWECLSVCCLYSVKKKKKKTGLKSFISHFVLELFRHDPFWSSMKKSHCLSHASLQVFCLAGFCLHEKPMGIRFCFSTFQVWQCMCSVFIAEQHLSLKWGQILFIWEMCWWLIYLLALIGAHKRDLGPAWISPTKVIFFFLLTGCLNSFLSDVLQLKMDMFQCQLSVSLPSVLLQASNSVIPSFMNFLSEICYFKIFSFSLLRCLEMPIIFKKDDFFNPHYLLPYF